MKNSGRYTIPTNEDLEPGSDQVLKNYYKITSKEEIEALEEAELQRAELELISIYVLHISSPLKIFVIFMNYGSAIFIHVLVNTGQFRCQRVILLLQRLVKFQD
jgi:hypothetical protein